MKLWQFFRKIRILLLPVFFTAEFFFCRAQAPYIQALQAKSNPQQPCIVIDPGHGGFDPGKVGINDALEKDLNLSIAQKLVPLFEDAGYQVLLTRDRDCDLAPADSANPKTTDLAKRVQFIEKAAPVFVISIHQNSFPDASAIGPQVFFYEGSVEGEALALCVQDALNESSCFDTLRSIMPNDNYYLLKKTPTPTIIVECGFLSNWSEAEMLADSDYQNTLANAIVSGALSYLSDLSNSSTPSSTIQAPESTK